MPMVPPRRQAEPVGSLISLSLLTRLDGDALASVLCTRRGCCRNVAPRAYGRRCSQLHTAGPTLWRTGPRTTGRAHVLAIPALRCASILTGATRVALATPDRCARGSSGASRLAYHRAVTVGTLSQRPRAAFGSSCLLGGRPPRSVRGTGDGGRKECRRRHSGPGRRTPGITANVRLRLRAVCPSSSIVTLCGRHCTWDRSQHVRRVGWDGRGAAELYHGLTGPTRTRSGADRSAAHFGTKRRSTGDHLRLRAEEASGCLGLNKDMI
jgi:hypothetical protein